MPVKRIALIGAIAAVALSTPFFGHGWNLLMHQIGAVVFMGNLIVSAAWMSLARRARSGDALRLGVRGVIFTDAIFTLPGALLLLLNGGILATPFFEMRAMWVFVSATLFLLSGVVWAAVLIPIQRRLAATVEAIPPGGGVPPACDALVGRWFRAGGVATLLPFATLVLMVLKPAF